jgi:hypothetical protein
MSAVANAMETRFVLVGAHTAVCLSREFSHASSSKANSNGVRHGAAMSSRLVLVGVIMALAVIASGGYCFQFVWRDDGEEIVFEARMLSSTPSLDVGYFVTRAGQVRQFGHHIKGKTSEVAGLPEDPGHVDSRANEGNAGETVALIPKATMKELLALVPAASGGVLVCCSMRPGRDTVIYRARVRGGDGRYSNTVLSREGNPSCTNTSPEAAIIVTWLHKYLHASENTVERYPIGYFDTSNRERAGKSRQCRPGDVFVEAADGTSYCMPRSSCCMGNNSCECNGDDACAGGRSHCRELGSEGLACVAFE